MSRPRPHSHIAPGTDLKFRVTPHIQDFQIAEDPFKIIVKNQAGRVCYVVPREDCFWDDLGRWYFSLEHVQEGLYEAIFEGKLEDGDFDKQRAVVTDRRPLTAVGRYTMPPKPHGTPRVEYEQVWSVSVDGDEYLCGSDGKYILTSDGCRIGFKSDKRKQIENMGKVYLDTMTSDEFKQFIEGKNQNGEIDTLPEMLDAAKGISDEETIHEHTEHQIEEELEEEAATNDDIDEMFS